MHTVQIPKLLLTASALMNVLAIYHLANSFQVKQNDIHMWEAIIHIATY